MFQILFCVLLIFNPVFARKPEVSKFPSAINLDKNEFYELNCNSAKGTKPFRFEWFKNAQKFDTQKNGVTIITKPSFSRLTFDEFKSDHSGSYSCKIINADGFDQTSTLLQIKGLSVFYSGLSFLTVVWRLGGDSCLNF